MNQTPTEIRRTITTSCADLDHSVVVARLAEAHVTIDYATREIEKLRRALTEAQKRERF